jgi:hypothetical protein
VTVRNARFSNSGGCEHDGCDPDQDAEVEQMPGDVPCPSVYALEPNIFTRKRPFLGMNAGPNFIGNTPMIG